MSDKISEETSDKISDLEKEERLRSIRRRRYIDTIKNAGVVGKFRKRLCMLFCKMYVNDLLGFIKNELVCKPEFDQLHHEWAAEIDQQIANGNMARIIVYGVNGCGKSYFLQKVIIWIICCHTRAAGVVMSTIIKQIDNLSSDLARLLEDSGLKGLVSIHDNTIAAGSSLLNIRANFAINEASIKGVHSIGNAETGMAALLIDEGSGINNTSYKAMFGNLSQGDVPTLWIICSNPEMTIESSILEKLIRYPEEAPEKFKTFKITADMCPNISNTYIEMGNYLFGEGFGKTIGEGELTFSKRLFDFDFLNKKADAWVEKYGSLVTGEGEVLPKQGLSRIMGIDIGGKTRAFHSICIREDNKVIFWNKFQCDKVEFASIIDHYHDRYHPDYAFYDNQGDELYNLLCIKPLIPFKTVKLPKESGYFCKRCEALDMLASWIMRDDTELPLEHNDIIYLSRLKYEPNYENIIRITPKNQISNDCQSGKDRIDALMYTFSLELESSESVEMSEFIGTYRNKINFKKLFAKKSNEIKYGVY